MRTKLNCDQGLFKIAYADMALNLEYKGAVTNSREVWNWDIAPLEDENGMIHIFISEWDDDFTGWFKRAKIVHYTAPTPEGPFTRIGDAITPSQLPNGYPSIYNQHIKKIDDMYVMVYATSLWEGDFDECITNQKTGMAYTKDLNGKWEFYNGDGIIVQKALEDTDFTYNSCCGCVNPCIEKIGGKYYIFFRAGKSRGGEIKYGYMVSDSLLGKYEISPNVTDNINYIEDADCFCYQDEVYLVTTDNTGGNAIGMEGTIDGKRDNAVGLLWKFKDGKLKLKDCKIAYGLLSDYAEMSKATCPEFGAFDKMERPAILMQSGIPTYIYFTAYTSLEGTGKSQTYVFKINKF